MKPIVNLVANLLIIAGIVMLAYQGFTYNKQEKIAELGSVQLTANTEKTVVFSPVEGGILLVGGIVLFIVGRKMR